MIFWEHRDHILLFLFCLENTVYIPEDELKASQTPFLNLANSSAPETDPMSQVTGTLADPQTRPLFPQLPDLYFPSHLREPPPTLSSLIHTALHRQLPSTPSPPAVPNDLVYLSSRMLLVPSPQNIFALDNCLHFLIFHWIKNALTAESTFFVYFKNILTYRGFLIIVIWISWSRWKVLYSASWHFRNFYMPCFL